MQLRRLIIAMLALASGLYGALGYQALNPSLSQASPMALDSAVISAQRAPQASSLAAADAQIRTAITTTLGNAQACVVVTQGERLVMSHQASTALIPASGAKLFTATAALDALGPDHSFITEVRSSSINDGVVEGPLYLVGGGDPMLFTSDFQASLVNQIDIHTPLERLADAVVDAGVRQVRGGVVGDDRLFDGVRSVGSWESGYMTGGQVGPIGALTVNHGFLRLDGTRAPAANPALHSATVFTDLLQARGVDVVAGPGDGAASSSASAIASVQSQPLSQVVGHMLRESDNSVAEVLLKHVGRSEAQLGSTASGLAATTDILSGADIPVNNLSLADGSGLDRSNRATCHSLNAALVASGVDSAISQGLAKAGETGTLRLRMNNTVAETRVIAKTGTLANASSLSGWVTPNGQEPISFSIIINGQPAPQAERLQDAIAVRLAALAPVASGT